MTALRTLARLEFLLYLRDPGAAFFTFALPLLLMALNSSGGNRPVPELGGALAVDVGTVGYFAFVLATAGLTGLPAVLAGYREKGILRRYQVTPLPVPVLLAGQVLAYVALCGAGLAVLTALAVVYGLTAPAAPLAVAVALVLGLASTLALGLALAGAAPNVRTAQAIGFALYFPSIFMSGALFPREFLPDVASRIGTVLPTTYVVRALRAGWSVGTWDVPAMAVTAAVLVVGAVLAVRTFRWS